MNFRKLHALLPEGTLAVGGGLAVLGLAAYLQLAIAGRALDAGQLASFAALWALTFTIGPGLFFPIEQEISRLVSSRRVRGEGTGPVIRIGIRLCGALLVLLGVLTLAASQPIADRLFDGDGEMVWALCGAFAGLAVTHSVRGALSGLRLFGRYGLQLGVDGSLRIALTGMLALLGVHDTAWYGSVLFFAPLLATFAALPPVREVLSAGQAEPLPRMMRGLGLLTASALLSQVVANVAIINVRLFDPGQTAVVAALLSALVLARIPLFVFGSLQASLLPGLSSAVAENDDSAFQKLLLRALTIVTGLGVVGGLIAVAAGGPMIRFLFNAPDALHRVDFLWLSVATLAFLWAMVLGQGVLALNRHRDQAMGWSAGVVALILVTLLPGDLISRVEWAYASGALVAAGFLAHSVHRRSRPLARGKMSPAPVAKGTVSA